MPRERRPLRELELKVDLRQLKSGAVGNRLYRMTI